MTCTSVLIRYIHQQGTGKNSFLNTEARSHLQWCSQAQSHEAWCKGGGRGSIGNHGHGVHCHAFDRQRRTFITAIAFSSKASACMGRTFQGHVTLPAPLHAKELVNLDTASNLKRPGDGPGLPSLRAIFPLTNTYKGHQVCCERLP
jgi:hypothetical protein